MALTKVVYVDGSTVIHAANLNNIQDEIIANGNKIGSGSLTGFTATDLVGAANELKSETASMLFSGEGLVITTGGAT